MKKRSTLMALSLLLMATVANAESLCTQGSPMAGLLVASGAGISKLSNTEKTILWTSLTTPRSVGSKSVAGLTVSNITTEQTPVNGSTATICLATVAVNPYGAMATAISDEIVEASKKRGESQQQRDAEVKSGKDLWAMVMLNTAHPGFVEAITKKQQMSAEQVAQYSLVVQIQYSVTPQDSGNGYNVRILQQSQPQWQ